MANYVQEKKRWLSENWLPVVLMTILGFLPFLPVLLSGKSLFASDQLSSPSWNFYFEALRKGTVPLWNPFGLAGMPTFDAGFGDAAYPVFILIGRFLPIATFMTWLWILHTLLAGLGAYYLVNRFFNLSRILSMGLGLAYMLNTNYISHIHAGHTGKFYVMSWLPLAVEDSFNRIGTSIRPAPCAEDIRNDQPNSPRGPMRMPKPRGCAVRRQRR